MTQLVNCYVQLTKKVTQALWAFERAEEKKNEGLEEITDAKALRMIAERWLEENGFIK